MPAYGFSFTPAPSTAMARAPRPPLTRWRRIQRTKYLIEHHDLPRAAIELDADGGLARVHAPRALIDACEGEGLAFMTDGCPDRNSKLEAFRDDSFAPAEEDTTSVPSAPSPPQAIYQGAAEVLDLPLCRRRGWPVLRRKIGGGAVYLDRDQLFYVYVFEGRTKGGDVRISLRVSQGIIDALAVRGSSRRAGQQLVGLSIATLESGADGRNPADVVGELLATGGPSEWVT